MTDERPEADKAPPPPGEADTPRQAEEDTAPEIRRLRKGDAARCGD